MEFLELRSVKYHYGKPEWTSTLALRIAIDVAKAIAYIHELDILHR
jgi:hypothetical protein